MDTEIEATFTDINPEEVRKRLADIGARLKQPERLMRRKIFDYPDGRLKRISGWIRLRDEGDKVTLAYKQLNDRTIHGTKEVSVVVSDFERAERFFVSIGLDLTSYQETKRESWELEETEIEIDTWPWIPSFVEIKGREERIVKAVAARLGFGWQDAKHGSVENIYQELYDVTEEEVDSWREIVFTPVPEWLRAKQRE